MQEVLPQQKSLLLDSQEFVILKPIGRGSYGIIEKVKWRTVTAAMKSIRVFNDHAKLQIEREIEILKYVLKPRALFNIK